MTAKEYLMQAYRLNELIESDVEELEHLRDLVGRITAPSFGERVQTTGSSDPPFVKYLGEVIEMEQKIHSELCELVSLKKQISGSLERVENREERLLLTYRYLNNYSWQEICDRLNVSMRTVHRIHAAALQNFSVPE